MHCSQAKIKTSVALLIATGLLLASCAGSADLTATTNSRAQLPYHAAIPGTCDKGGATWLFRSMMTGGGYTCTATALRLNTDNGSEAYMSFVGFQGTTFTQFDASVDVTFPTWDATVGFALIDASGQYYAQLNGFHGTNWILRIANSGVKNYLVTYELGSTTSIHMQISRRKGSLKMTVSSPINALVTAPEHTLGLALLLDSSVPTYADFSNFTFTPIL